MKNFWTQTLRFSSRFTECVLPVGASSLNSLKSVEEKGNGQQTSTRSGPFGTGPGGLVCTHYGYMVTQRRRDWFKVDALLPVCTQRWKTTIFKNSMIPNLGTVQSKFREKQDFLHVLLLSVTDNNTLFISFY